MFGAMLFGMLADKIGRKKVIIICVTLFSGFTFAGGFASNPTEFGILRFHVFHCGYSITVYSDFMEIFT